MCSLSRSARVPFSLLVYDNHNQQFIVTANLCQTFDKVLKRPSIERKRPTLESKETYYCSL